MPSPLRTPPGFPPEIEPAFEQVTNDMVWLSWKLELYRNGFLNEQSRKVLFSMYTETAFWILEDSLQVDLTLSIARLMDPPVQGNKTNLTLRYLFDLIRDHGNVPALLASIEAKYEAVKHILEPISVLRNRVLAHRDRPTALSNTLQLPITPEKIETVCRVFQEIINDIDGHFRDSSTMFRFQLSYSNIDSVVRHLERGIRGMEEDREQEMQRWMPKPLATPSGRGEVH